MSLRAQQLAASQVALMTRKPVSRNGLPLMAVTLTTYTLLAQPRHGPMHVFGCWDPAGTLPPCPVPETLGARENQGEIQDEAQAFPVHSMHPALDENHSICNTPRLTCGRWWPGVASKTTTKLRAEVSWRLGFRKPRCWRTCPLRTAAETLPLGCALPGRAPLLLGLLPHSLAAGPASSCRCCALVSLSPITTESLDDNSRVQAGCMPRLSLRPAYC